MDIHTYPLHSTSALSDRPVTLGVDNLIAATTDTFSSILAITIRGLQKEQSRDELCRSMSARLREGERVSFSFNDQNF